MAGGIAAIPASASASPSATRTAVTPDASWIAGEYWSLGSCEFAGNVGLNDGDWKEYICIWSVKGTFYLSVSNGQEE
jgi:hypothetical protein